MAFYQKLKENGIRISDRYAGSMDYFFLTPQSLSLLDNLTPLFAKYVKGKLLDAGAGRLAYKFLLQPYCNQYKSIDIADRLGKVEIIGDIQRMGLRGNSFDTVFCSQVLEHVPKPQEAINECYRVLKEGGYFLLSVPHLSYLHNEPHDYYRYTRHGLRFMLEKAGFEIVHLEAAGGLLSFLGHIPCTIFLNLLYENTTLHTLSMKLNKLYVRFIYWLDKTLEPRKVYALNYVAVAQKAKVE